MYHRKKSHTHTQTLLSKNHFFASDPAAASLHPYQFGPQMMVFAPWAITMGQRGKVGKSSNNPNKKKEKREVYQTIVEYQNASATKLNIHKLKKIFPSIARPECRS